MLAKKSLHCYGEGMEEQAPGTAEPMDDAARSEERHRGDRVLDTGALRALAHPLRVRIYDILSQYGPQTASSLAAKLGESTGSTSYHLRALAKQDLIREVKVLGDWAFMWSRLTVVATPPSGGARMKRAGFTLSILRKEGGRWRLTRDANMLAPVADD